MTRLSVVVALLSFLALTVGALPAAATETNLPVSPASPADVSGATLAIDPLLDAVVASRALPAEKCNDYGQCIGVPNYTPCDTPQGCVCYDPPGPVPSSCGRP